MLNYILTGFISIYEYIKSFMWENVPIPNKVLMIENYVIIKSIDDLDINDYQIEILYNKKVIVVNNVNISKIIEKLPDDINELIIKGSFYNHEVITKFPANLKILSLYSGFSNHTFLRYLPLGLEYLQLDGGFDDVELLQYLPQSIVNLDLKITPLSGYLNNLHSNIKILSLGKRYKDYIDNLPINLKELHVWGLYPKENIKKMTKKESRKT